MRLVKIGKGVSKKNFINLEFVAPPNPNQPENALSFNGTLLRYNGDYLVINNAN